MAQSFFPTRKLVAEPAPIQNQTAVQMSGFAPSHAAEIVANTEDVQAAYIEQKDR